MLQFLKSPVVLATFLVCLICLSGYLHLELGQRQEDLDTTRTNLAASESSNAALLAEKTDLEATLANAIEQNIELAQFKDDLLKDIAALELNLSASKSSNETLQGDKIALEATLRETNEKLAEADEQNSELTLLNKDLVQEKSVIQSSLAASESTNKDLRLDKSNLEESLDTVNKQLANTSEELANANDQNMAISRTNAALIQDKAELTGNLAASRAAYDNLEDEKTKLEEQAGNVEQLMAQATALQEEIDELTAQRRPLLLKVERNGFACTGSMEPKLTCLDEVTWLNNFHPMDIVVGAIISFNPNCWQDEPDGISTAHRVMKIKVENGVHYYWPKGDASREADGCWVPESDVDGYIIEIHKNVQPQNSGLRNSVNRAASLEEEARLEFEAAETEYDAIIERYCGPGVDPGDCTLPTSQYNIATRAFRIYESAYENWERYYVYYQCWIEIAETQNRWPVGVYVPCILAPQ